MNETQRVPDMIGRRFGKLTVLSREPNRRFPGGFSDQVWKVRCDCGREKICVGRYLRRGSTKSCGGKGCMVQPPRVGVAQFTSEEATARKLVLIYKRGARKRRLDFTLSVSAVKDLIFKNCFYCAKPPVNKSLVRSHPVPYSGIDRVNNMIGYVEGNVVPCCTICNLMKGKLSLEEFRSHIRAIAAKF